MSRLFTLLFFFIITACGSPTEPGDPHEPNASFSEPVSTAEVARSPLSCAFTVDTVAFLAWPESPLNSFTVDSAQFALLAPPPNVPAAIADLAQAQWLQAHQPATLVSRLETLRQSSLTVAWSLLPVAQQQLYLQQVRTHCTDFGLFLSHPSWNTRFGFCNPTTLCSLDSQEPEVEIQLQSAP